MYFDVLPPPEPNWLLTSLMTASAAVISIVAGLLVARLVSNDSDRQHADRELAVQQAARSAAANELARVRRALKREQAHDFIRRSLRQIVEELGIVTVAELMATHEHDDLTPSDLAQPVDEAKTRMVTVRTNVLNRVTDRDDNWATNWPRTWAATERKYRISVPPGEEYLHELVWEQLWQARTQEELDQQRQLLLKDHDDHVKARDRWLSSDQNEPEPQPPRLTLDDLNRRWDAELETRPTASTPPRRQERIDALADSVATSTETLALAQARVALAEGPTQGGRRSGVVVAALVILGYLTATGVAAPLWLLAQTPVLVGPWWRWMLSTGFVLGVSALIVMLVIASRAPRRTVPNQSPGQPPGA